MRSGPECLERDLAAMRTHFESDRSTALLAFQAVALCVATQWGKEGPDGPLLIQVPYWAAQAIAIGFKNYEGAHESGRSTTFGEAFGVEGGGQGKQPKLDQNARDRREQLIVVEIVRHQRQGQPRKDAIELACNQFDIDERTAKRYLKRWETLAKRQLAIYFGDNPSGGDVTA
jgi:hypothetical protein